MELIMQPNPYACGQACIAMLAGVSCIFRGGHTNRAYAGIYTLGDS